ncbi:hypothetical protein [Litorilituus lipolyticus]|uniref:Uncharacterized protein n=1 Tax=Litorilituus lipolyticus TaxID=2491017 RepID=A0A502KRW1_9GAMM|nr:hypothetical protein [Litorilituus lipolyticus]TPH12741.1 hypothetical protein EPA86_15005 [Litorilituus lipolyticus]
MERETSPSTKFSIICQSLYLANLLLLPGVCFFILIYYLLQYSRLTKNQLPQKEAKKLSLNTLGIGKIHLYRSVQITCLAGVMLVVFPLIVFLFSNQFEASIMVSLFYFITLHAAFVLIGMLNLSRAMARKLPIF